MATIQATTAASVQASTAITKSALTQDQILDGGLLICTILYQWQAQPASLNWRNRILLAVHSVLAAFYVRSGIDLTGEFFKAQMGPSGPFEKWLALGGGDKPDAGKKWLVEKFVKFMMSTYLLHGLIRAYAALEFENKIARQMSLISYVCEIFQNAPLVSSTPETTPTDTFKGAIIMALWLASLDGVSIQNDAGGNQHKNQ